MGGEFWSKTKYIITKLLLNLVLIKALKSTFSKNIFDFILNPIVNIFVSIQN